jgi:cytoskeletal protein RodZ
MINNNFTLEQQQKLKDIGANLNHIRVAKNISLETIANNTHISKRVLAAIEAGDVNKLPEPIYVRGLLAKFAREIEATEIDLDFQALPNSQNIPSNSIAQTNKHKHRPNFELRSPHLYLLYILLVIISVKAVTNLVERPVIVDRTSPSDSEANSEVASPEPAVPLEPTKVAPQLISQSSNSDAVTVGINLQERCWLKVMVDGKVAFEGTLAKGTQRQWTGDREVTIRAGNAGGVVISFNNQQQQILGEPGEVEEITYTVN